MVAVIFTSKRTKVVDNYSAVNDELEAMAAELPGFIKTEWSRNEDGFGISISYWKTMEDARNFKKIPEHLMAQQNGRDKWYEWYNVKVCTVEREYGFTKED
jgi:heme-degrading monooxygenase HmoA